MKKRVAITGGKGQLGADITETFGLLGYDVYGIHHDEVDITNAAALLKALDRIQPHFLINAAAYHQVELCEQFPETAMLVNTNAPTMMAHYCKQNSVRFVHFSTDYVFDGNKESAYTERDHPNPINQYGLSKRLGELGILKMNPDALIIRVSALYGKHPCRAKGGLNFVQLMLKLAAERGEVKVVNDEYVSPTSTHSIAQRLPKIIDSGFRGIIHLTSEGYCSWYEFARVIFEYTHTNVKLRVATANDFPSKTPRPAYSVLENTVINQSGLERMPDWRDALKEYLESNT